jgi:hypothetical protein
MNDFGGETSLEAEMILKKIVEDFERLDSALDAAIAGLQVGNGGHGGIEALLRAREAVRKGAALARDKVGSES